MIELFEQDIKRTDRQSSKGDQLKWKNGDIWYKADYTGYEGLSEYVISRLLIKSTLLPDEFVIYDLETIQYRKNIYRGAKSSNFLKEGWQLITLERLFHNFFGKSLYKSIYQIKEYENRLRFLVDQVERITGLKEFGKYINKLFTIDAIFLNEDRHTHNIAVLMNEKGEFSYCPVFDNGAGLLADTMMDYPMEEDVNALMKQSRSKTICGDYDEQLDLSEKLYGQNLKFSFGKNDIKVILQNAEIYSLCERERIEQILIYQMGKYRYLFTKQGE